MEYGVVNMFEVGSCTVAAQARLAMDSRLARTGPGSPTLCERRMVNLVLIPQIAAGRGWRALRKLLGGTAEFGHLRRIEGFGQQPAGWFAN